MSDKQTLRDWPAIVKQVAIAAVYGAIAGAVAAVVLWAMNGLSHFLWQGTVAWWRVFATIMAGGVLIAALRLVSGGHEADLARQLQQADNPMATRQRLILCLAGIAIVAVGFGGAIGPEAGVLAVVAEMSTLVSFAIGKSRDEQRLVGQAGAAGALSGIYGSPPGGAAMTDNETPTPLLYLAAVAGLLGFLLAAKFLLEGGGLRIRLEDYVSPLDGTDMLHALLSALLGGLAGLGFVYLLPLVRSLLDRVGGVVAQTLAGTLAFAILASLFPVLRFSGHHELEAMLAWGQGVGVAALMVLALLKALALAICLASGWRGGAAFPLLFVGAAAGAAALSVMPQTDVTLALIAGMSAAITVGMGRPIAAMLIVVFLVSPLAVGPLSIGVLFGYGLSKIGPKAELH